MPLIALSNGDTGFGIHDIDYILHISVSDSLFVSRLLTPTEIVVLNI